MPKQESYGQGYYQSKDTYNYERSRLLSHNLYISFAVYLKVILKIGYMITLYHPYYSTAPTLVG